jgi:hypothetical protein
VSNNEIFADTFGRIDFLGGVIRIELIAIDPDQQVAEGQLRMSPRHRLIMPLDGFLHAYGTMSDLVRQLSERSAEGTPMAAAVAQPPRPAAGAGPAAEGSRADGGEAPAAGGSSPRPPSPNF